jgi:micrococcal nuclease
MKNQSFLTLIVGLTIVAILAIGSLPSVQNSLANALGLLDQPVSTKKVAVTGKVEHSKVNRVVDGDTIILQDGRTIRYLNVDTPETKKPGTPVQCYGPEASQLNKILVDGKELNLVADKESTDKYGRDLRLVFLIGSDTNDPAQSVNAQIVKQGYGRSLIINPNNTFKETFQALEYKAKQSKLGLWGSCSKPFEE